LLSADKALTSGMTSNDKQIDVLMRRYAKAAPRTSVSGHLDADELSAFAEGALPPATRAGYVSHLADCDECRKQASALAISSGAIVRTEESPSTVVEGRSFWQVLAGLFALPVLRYAAFAAVLLIVAGVAFVALRRSRSDSPLIAANEQPNQERDSAVKPPVELQEGSGGNKQVNTETRSAPSPQLSAGNDQIAKADTAPKPAEAPVGSGLMKEAPLVAPVTAEKKAADTEVAKTAPSYAPVPPGDVATQKKQENYRESQTGSGISGPRQQQQKLDTADKFGQERERDANRDANKDVRTDDLARKSGAPASVAANQPPPSPRRAIDEKAKGPMRNMENNTNAINRNENLGRAEPPKTTSTGGSDRAATEEAPQTRSAGGRKFRKQGAAWVDQKFKASMTLKSVSRGSDAFDELDSGLRSIAQQLGGEVIVVWKGKAYLIK
jgi:Putative zinc-finger